MTRLQLEDWENLLEEVESIKHDFEVKIMGEFEHQFSDLKAFRLPIRKLVATMLNRIYELNAQFEGLVYLVGEEVAKREDAKNQHVA